MPSAERIAMLRERRQERPDHRQDVLVGQFEGILDMGLVLGFAGTGRKNRNAVVIAEPFELLV